MFVGVLLFGFVSPIIYTFPHALKAVVAVTTTDALRGYFSSLTSPARIVIVGDVPPALYVNTNVRELAPSFDISKPVMGTLKV
jgi:hypothetical protein